ncbi:helix-turn-helix domain-containing protein [Actinopolymorpha rutila]|uniref:Helix-turn-helix domain-containing protein n=2 Tax=Actinopolymorpha TaxID=117156 RepID=A0A1H1XT34_9ACTN|nr:transcriptional regulator with XRE-family HTH domain [Actinopolymorpha rutila]SDT12385.1 Helix-turn-helix domain-containing protein [Actinopolymorpha singaporensis]
MVLVRHLLGGVLRRQRLRRGLTLREVSLDARVSLGYISEIERGQKEASSELLAAICTALDVPLSDVLREVSDEIDKAQTRSVLTAAPRQQVIRKVTSKRIAANRIDGPRLDTSRIEPTDAHRDVVVAA